MSDDTRRILDLLAQGKITVDEADQLLRAIGSTPPEAAAAPDGADRRGDVFRERLRGWRGMLGVGAVRVSPTDAPGARYLRIEVHKHAAEGRAGKDVNIRVPIALVRGGMRLGAIIPGYVGDDIKSRLRERGFDVDLSKLDQAALEDLLKNFGEMTVDVDQGKAQVRITCE